MEFAHTSFRLVGREEYGALLIKLEFLLRIYGFFGSLLPMKQGNSSKEILTFFHGFPGEFFCRCLAQIPVDKEMPQVDEWGE
jgi:hypothetical protein